MSVSGEYIPHGRTCPVSRGLIFAARIVGASGIHSAPRFCTNTEPCKPNPSAR
jgi:hypothetical protein